MWKGLLLIWVAVQTPSWGLEFSCFFSYFKRPSVKAPSYEIVLPHPKDGLNEMIVDPRKDDPFEGATMGPIIKRREGLLAKIGITLGPASATGKPTLLAEAPYEINRKVKKMREEGDPDAPSFELALDDTADGVGPVEFGRMYCRGYVPVSIDGIQYIGGVPRSLSKHDRFVHWPAFATMPKALATDSMNVMRVMVDVYDQVPALRSFMLERLKSFQGDLDFFSDKIFVSTGARYSRDLASNLERALRRVWGGDEINLLRKLESSNSEDKATLSRILKAAPEPILNDAGLDSLMHELLGSEAVPR